MPDASSLIDEPGMDTWLARLLHEQQRVDLETLQELVQQARARRGQGHTLARSLVDRDLIPLGELEQVLGGLVTQQEDPPRPNEPWVGVRIDDYVVRRRLGAGGMGAVFLAEHTGTGAEVAIKLLSLRSDPELLLRFQREAEAQARVDRHPNVARIHATGSAQGHTYLVIDLCPGGDLAARLERGPLEVREAAALARDLARGLAHVHAQGVLHRDLKPANVLFDDEGRPKLVDFGLAQVAGAQTLTQTGALLGTPAYMAPEQARGEREAVDARTDVYGLGAILYAALTARPPFVGSSVTKLLSQVLNDEPTPPRALRPEVPARLESICLQALHKDPARRFSDAAAMAEALEAWLAGSPPPASPGAGPQLALGFAAGALVSLLVASALWPAAPQPAPQPAPPKSPAQPDRGRVLDRAVRWFDRAWVDRPAVTTWSEGKVSPEDLLQAARGTLERADPGVAAQAASIAEARERLITYRLLRPDTPLPSALVEAIRRLRGSPHAAVWRAMFPRQLEWGPHKLGLARLLDPAPPDAKPIDTWPPDWGPLMAKTTGFFPSTQIDLIENFLLWHPEISPLWVRIGYAYSRAGKYGRARRCLELASARIGSAHVHYRLGSLLHRLGKLAEARRWLERALEPGREISRESKVWGLRNYARLLLELGEPVEGMRQLRRLEKHPWFASSYASYWFLRADLHTALGEPKAAAHSLREAQKRKRY